MGELHWTDLRRMPCGPVVWVGRHRTSRPVAIPRHRLPAWQICVVVSGRLDLLVDGRPIEVPGGHWLLLPPGSSLASARLRSRGSIGWIGVRPASAAGLAPARRAALARTLARLGPGPHAGAGRVQAAADGVLAAGSDAWDRMARGLAVIAAMTTAGPPPDPAIAAALTALHDDPLAPWTVPGLAAQAGLRARAFHRRFVAATGLTPHDAVVRERLLVAESRLRSGEAVGAAAAAAGFASRRGFIRAFRDRYGCTPAGWLRGSASPCPPAPTTAPSPRRDRSG